MSVLSSGRSQDRQDAEEEDVVLDSPQCPHTWSLPAICSSESNVIRFQDLLQVSDSPWTSVTLRLLLSYEYGQLGEADAARRQVDACRAVMAMSMSARSPGGGCPDLLLARSKPALCHVLSAARHPNAQGDAATANMEALAHLDNRQRAAIWALRATALRHYGCKGWQEAQQCAERAAVLDMEEPAWLHLLGLQRRDAGALEAAVRWAGGLGLGHALGPAPALHLAASLLRRHAANPGSVHRAAAIVNDTVEMWRESAYAQMQGAHLLWLCTLLLGETLSSTSTSSSSSASRGAQDASARATELAPDCVLARLVDAVVTRQTVAKEPLRRAVRDTYGVEWRQALDILEAYSFGLVYLMSRQVTPKIYWTHFGNLVFFLFLAKPG